MRLNIYFFVYKFHYTSKPQRLETKFVLSKPCFRFCNLCEQQVSLLRFILFRRVALVAVTFLSHCVLEQDRCRKNPEVISSIGAVAGDELPILVYISFLGFVGDLKPLLLEGFLALPRHRAR